MELHRVRNGIFYVNTTSCQGRMMPEVLTANSEAMIYITMIRL